MNKNERNIRSICFSGVCLPSVGLHHDSVPASLLEGREAGVPVWKQPEQDFWLPAGEEDLGSWRLLRPLQTFLHPRHHHGEHHAAGLPWWKNPLQRQVEGRCSGGCRSVKLQRRRWNPLKLSAANVYFIKYMWCQENIDLLGFFSYNKISK